VELPYLDNKLQQVASLWEESQLFVLLFKHTYQICTTNIVPVDNQQGYILSTSINVAHEQINVGCNLELHLYMLYNT
jgi:hypothetical protein